MRSKFYKFFAILPILLMFILSAGSVSAADISAKVKEFKVGPEGKWIISVVFKNNSKNRIQVKKGIYPGKTYTINFKTSAPMNSAISNVKLSSIVYKYKAYTPPKKKQTSRKSAGSAGSGYSLKNIKGYIRNLDYKTFRIDVHFDVLNNRNNASVLRVDDIVVSFSLKNRDVPTVHKRYRIRSKNVRIKPLGSHRFRFKFKVEDPYAGQAGSYTLTNVRVSAKPRFGQTQNRNNSGNRVIIIQ